MGKARQMGRVKETGGKEIRNDESERNGEVREAWVKEIGNVKSEENKEVKTCSMRRVRRTLGNELLNKK